MTRDESVMLNYIVDALLRCLIYSMQLSGMIMITFVFLTTTLAERKG